MAWLFPARIGRSGFWIRTLLMAGLVTALQGPLYEWWLAIMHGGGSLGSHFLRCLPISIVTVALTWFSVEHIAIPRLIDAQWPRWLSFLLLVPFVSAPFILILGLARTRLVQT